MFDGVHPTQPAFAFECRVSQRFGDRPMHAFCCYGCACSAQVLPQVLPPAFFCWVNPPARLSSPRRASPLCAVGGLSVLASRQLPTAHPLAVDSVPLAAHVRCSTLCTLGLPSVCCVSGQRSLGRKGAVVDFAASWVLGRRGFAARRMDGAVLSICRAHVWLMR
jgi:hypothetical protein